MGALFTTVLAVVDLLPSVDVDGALPPEVFEVVESAALVAGVAELHGHFGSCPHSSSVYLMVNTAF